jgi:3-oxoacyl-[acyl-carrier-protein] synthase-3
LLDVDEWARQVQIPNQKVPGTFLTGADVQRITGIEQKSWDPELFADIGVVVETARQALRSAQLPVTDIQAALVVTATPYETQLDADAFRIFRSLGLPDHIVPIQLNAGCCGMARAMGVLAQMNVESALIVSYEISSLYMRSRVYYENSVHPLGDKLWMSPAVFSDGAAAIVVRRTPDARGFSIYSRDSQSFDGGPGFDDPLIHYPGGGGWHPPGTPGCEALSCYGMAGEMTRRYYSRGITLNHQAIQAFRPDYSREVRRIYVHQASPRLVDAIVHDFVELGIPREKLATNAHRYGNLVTPSTMALLHEDVANGDVRPGDEVCFSVVGAGPERGAFLAPVAIERVMESVTA